MVRQQFSLQLQVLKVLFLVLSWVTMLHFHLRCILIAVSLLYTSFGYVFNEIGAKYDSVEGRLANHMNGRRQQYTEVRPAPDAGDNEVDAINVLSDRLEGFNLIFPGTKWCGAGNVAENEDDLGPSAEADRCCREHDHCPDIIEAGGTRHNLTNDSFYTRLNCKCDTTFHQCLHNANTTTATKVGIMYFELLGTQCFRNDFPATGCRKRGGYLKMKCIAYSYDTTQNKQYQWFDVSEWSSEI